MSYIDDIPIGKHNAISRAQLAHKWGVDDRTMRERVSKLRAEDNGDDFIIVSQSRGGVNGYWRTDDPEEIRYFFNETKKRAINTFKPLKKMRRVLKNVSQL